MIHVSIRRLESHLQHLCLPPAWSVPWTEQLAAAQQWVSLQVEQASVASGNEFFFDAQESTA
eukprot:m.31355 g.31355  ORF g.31355 m.31355 type:complete len:62 (-) comp12454_c0_seq1:35-220(-)